MGIIESWLLNKGLTLSESAVQSLLQIEDAQAILSRKLDGVLVDLDQLLDAPYQEALLHVREGEIEQAIDHLKGAIARRPLHVPARLLHIQLLCLQKRYEAALENYWDLLNAFSYREDLVPAPLYQAFLDKLADTPVHPGEGPLRLRRQEMDCNPRSVWCSPSAIAIEWSSHSDLFFLHWDAISVTVSDWTGRALFASKSGRKISLEMLTSGYMVYRDGDDDTFHVVSLASGREVAESPLDEATFRAIFLPPGADVASLRLHKLTRFTREQISAGACAFSNLTFALGQVEKTEEQDELLPCGDSEPIWTTTTVTLKWPTVDCLPRPEASWRPGRRPELAQAAVGAA